MSTVLDDAGPLDEAHRVGALLGKSRTTDLADAALVALAATRSPADIVASDPGDIAHLLGAAKVRARVVTL